MSEILGFSEVSHIPSGAVDQQQRQVGAGQVALQLHFGGNALDREDTRGVEYIIPGGDRTHAEPPMFLGEHLHVQPELDIRALHVWVARHNPDGIFEDCNPEVHCDFAED